MKRFMRVGRICAFLSALEMCSPAGVISSAAEPTPPAVPQPRQVASPAKLSMDVTTNAAGELRGAVVHRNNSPAINAKVVLCMVNGKDPQEVSTDANGRFLLRNVRPGVYTVAVQGDKGQTQSIARVWRPETAPPIARSVALVSLPDAQPSDDVVRGQPGVEEEVSDSPFFSGRPVIRGTIIGAGVVGIIAISGGFNHAQRTGVVSPFDFPDL